jgi:hypothetical protein
MPTGANPRREREYRKLERQFRQEHRYPGREEEVAARIVNKQRSLYGETREEIRKDKTGASPDRDLPLKDYQKLTIVQINAQLPRLSTAELKKIRGYELRHKNRKGLLQRLDRQLNKD